MSAPNDDLDLYVLDALANDIEAVDDVLRMLNSDTSLGWTNAWGKAFGRDEIILALRRLVVAEAVRVLVLTEDGKELMDWAGSTWPTAREDEVYFAMTDRGRHIHSAWKPHLPPNGGQDTGD